MIEFLLFRMKKILLDNTIPNASVDNITVSGGRLNAFNALLGVGDVLCGTAVPEDNAVNAMMKIFPNPSKGGDVFLMTELPPFDRTRISVVDITGREVYSSGLVSAKLTVIHMPLLPEGIYGVVLRKQDGETTALRLLIAR